MFKKVLVPLDGTELTAKILPYVEDMAKNQKMKVILMTASHFDGTVGLITKDTLEQLRRDEKEISEKYLAKIANDMKNKGLDVDWVYKVGLAFYEIIATAKEQNADLIAMAHHDGNGGAAWNFGSVSEKVLENSPVPVLALSVKGMRLPSVKPEWFLGA